MSAVSRFVTCDRCHRLIPQSKARYEAPLTLCRACAERYYTHCVFCGCFAERELLNDPGGSGQYCCDECFAQQQRNCCNSGESQV